MRSYAEFMVFTTVNSYLKEVYNVNGFPLSEEMDDFMDYLRKKSDEEFREVADKCYCWHYGTPENYNFMNNLLKEAEIFEVVEEDNVRDFLIERGYFYLGDNCIETMPFFIEANNNLILIDRIFAYEDYVVGNLKEEFIEIEKFPITF